MLLLTQIIINTILIGSLYTLISLGFFVIYKSLGVINLAHGEFILVASYLAWFIHRQFAIDPLFSILVVIPLMFIMSYALSAMYQSHEISQTPIFAMIITWAIAILLRNSFQIVLSTTPRTTDTILESAMQWGGVTLPVLRSVLAVVVGILIISMMVMYKRTTIGRQIRCVASNIKAAEMLGMNVRRIKTYALTISMVLIGIAGVLISPIYALTPNLGQWLTIKCLAVILLTGNRSIAYVWLSGLCIAFLEIMVGTMAKGYGTNLTELITFGVILWALIWNNSLRDFVRVHYARITA